jgi:hypothetical protein
VSAIICEHCGDDFTVELLEYWPEDRTFQIVTCCEASHDEQLAELAWYAKHEPRELGRWLSDQTGHQVRQVVADADAGVQYGNGGISVDNGLRLATIGRTAAQAWIAKHHRHNEAPSCSRFNLAIYNGSELVAVTMVGNPVARLTMQKHPDWLEVNRVCVSPELPSWLVWNACSMLYAAAGREAAARGFKRLITYTREDESGGTLVAAAWSQTHRTRLDKRNWQRAGREARATRMTPCRKIRWERGLDKRERRAVARDAERFAELQAKRARRAAQAAQQQTREQIQAAA